VIHYDSEKISTGYTSWENLAGYDFTIRLIFSCGVIEPEQCAFFSYYVEAFNHDELIKT